jgi:diaminohydroxyphosphoribosylaminopyrimidine deaminase/5-amino-6-(5-phosphoribosylamino)uracil reductase
MADDERFMRRALQLAALGLGRTAPNPPVGAVVVRDGQVVGEDFHPRAGEPHAEALALQEAGARARGADLYCTLEPCCHQGRTPPCAEAIIAAGVARVVYAFSDPDIRCAGQGEERLRQAGLEVTAGLLRDAAQELYEPYMKHKTTGRPFVTLKLALTLDGKAAAADGSSRWITGEAARRLVHQWRNEADAVMVGSGTVLSDDPQLTVRPEPTDGRQPLRVIVDTQVRTPLQARVLSEPGRCLVAVGQALLPARQAALEQAGAEVLPLPEAGGHVDLAALMQALGQRDIMSVLCEGGPTLAAGLVRAGLVDKLRLFYAPKLLGETGRDGLGNLRLTTMAEALPLRLAGVESLDPDILVTAYPCSPD